MLQQPCIQIERVICPAPTVMTGSAVTSHVHILIADASQCGKHKFRTFWIYNRVMRSMEEPSWQSCTWSQVPPRPIGIAVFLSQCQHSSPSCLHRQPSRKDETSADGDYGCELLRGSNCQRPSSNRTHGKSGNVYARFVNNVPLANVRQHEQDFIDERGPHATPWTLGCQNEELASSNAFPRAMFTHLVQLTTIIFASLS